MGNPVRRFGAVVAVSVVSLGTLLGVEAPSGQANSASSARPQIQAEILPAATFAVGSSLSSGPDGKGYGVGLTANDVSNLWTSCNSICTLDFVFFVFSNQDETAKVSFLVLSPASKTVYRYSWSSKLTGTNWYVAYAKGNYSSAGTYFAEVDVNGQLDGWVPVVMSK